jgi:hypothetical protein
MIRLVKFGRVSKSWYSFSKDEQLWKYFCVNHTFYDVIDHVASREVISDINKF